MLTLTGELFLCFCVLVVFGYLKSKIYLADENTGKTRPVRVDDLWDRIVAEWWAIPDALLVKAGYQGTYSQERIDRMMAHNGKRFENES